MNDRFYSLDVFRGATVALMILVNNPGSWAHIFPPLAHAPWHGVTPTDLVFPFFLFAIGNAFAFVMPKLEQSGPISFWRKTIKRSILIFAIGLFLNWFPFVRWQEGELIFKSFETLRLFGVLQRIAICYFVAAILIYYLKRKWLMVAVTLILLGYWLLCWLMNPTDPYSLSGWFGTQYELALFGVNHLYKGGGVPFDPEGLMNSFAAIAQVVFGYWVGASIIKKGKTSEMLNQLFMAGLALVVVGLFWDLAFPMNKKIWTSSYTIYTSGLATLSLSVFIYLIEFKSYSEIWSRFFDVFGKNPLFIFAMSALIPKTLWLFRFEVSIEGVSTTMNPLSWFYNFICKPILPADPRIGSFIYALCFIVFMWLLAWLLDKKRIYIKV
uniref:acyltransferase family protein n=1 Tax=Fulvivirga sp. TaxID=1931237 RepID=UPI0040490346